MATGSHPRRTPQRAMSPQSSSPKLSLKKGQTFNSRTQLNTDLINLENARYMPRRSPTCIKTLEDYVSQEDLISSRQDMIAKYLQGVDAVVEGRTSDTSLFDEQLVLAVPRVMVGQQSIPDRMDVDEKKHNDAHHHYSDSGIGSSVDTPVTGININKLPPPVLDLANTSEERQSINSLSSSAGSIATTHSAIARSFSPDAALQFQGAPELSESGLREIQTRILNPILNNSELNEFHSLVKSIPEQVHKKYIANLRDLEKTFLYSTPVSFRTYLSACAVAYYHGRDVKRFSLSSDSFEKFWEFSIRALHTTVEYLNERDQKRSSDRPYTNNYFLDLVEQIRRYAQVMARTREREENGEDLDEMDYSPYVTPAHSDHLLSPNHMTHVLSLTHPRPLLTYLLSTSSSCMSSFQNPDLHIISDETVVVEGGLSTNGRPAELVRKKNGKSISLAPENAGVEAMSSKRPLTDDEYDDDDDVLRSMARRRKSDRAGDVMHVCSSCKKEFKRPCDLTKHEKTHSRPFKCTEPSCRYHAVGWPTEKERDRHVNDKHSSAPEMYECHFKPCTYSSKRESNCKQHMEKAHGWTYVRSKSNGRKKAATTSSGSVMQSPPTPFSPFAATPTSSHVLDTPQSVFAPSPWAQPENNFGFGDPNGIQASPAQPTFDFGRRDSITTAGTNFTYSSGFSPDQFNQSLDSISMEPFGFTSPMLQNNNDFLSTIPLQQPTPAPSIGAEFNFNPSAISDEMLGNPHISSVDPGVGLYSPNFVENIYQDEGFVDGNLLGQDFELFGDTTSSTENQTAWMDLNPSNLNAQFDLGFDSSMFPQ
jgi:hypothetical protein